MPTSILVWNIQGFTQKKILDLTKGSKDLKKNQEYTDFQYSKRRLNYILQNIKFKKPDIFVVVEIVSGQGEKGSLVNSNGAAGCLNLLDQLRGIDKAWNLVPPLRLIDKVQLDVKDGYANLVKERQYTEGIAVFFKGDKLDFIGPYVWPETMDPDDQHPELRAEPDGDSGPYPPAWSKCLPDKNYCAGQFEFFHASDKEAQFPSSEARNPLMVKFQETGGGRIFSIVAVHLPPQRTGARTAFSRATGYFSNWPLAANEIMLMVGDFNIPASSWEFRGLADLPIKVKGEPLPDPFKAVFKASTKPDSSMYYTKRFATASKYMQKDKILDNILYRCGANIKIATVKNEIVNRVTGDKPLMNTPLGDILAIKNQDRQNERFRNLYNFAQLGPSPGTSDHLALYAEF
jgi:hypothetical protein